jgi:hypothetical protein
MSSKFKFRHFLARYGKDRLTQFKRNPFTECLPPLPSDEAIREGLLQVTQATDQMRSRSKEWRIQNLDRLEEFFIPLPRHVRFARAALKLMYTGYGPRIPYEPKDWTIEQDMYEAQLAGGFGSLPEDTSKAELTMGLVGASGCGKSFTIKHLAQKFATPIFHEELGRWQLPMLVLEMAYDGESVHTMATAIFEAIDKMLPGGNYSELYMASGKLNAERRLYRAFKLAREVTVGIMFFDEAQRQRSMADQEEEQMREDLEGRRSRGRPRKLPKNETPLVKLLISASNTSHIPSVMAGTMEMPAILGARFTRLRRISGRGSAFWHPLKPTFTLEGGKVGEFETMLMGLWNYQLVKHPVSLSENLLKVFYNRTAGIPDSMVKLFSSVQEAAIVSGIERITPHLVDEVYREEQGATSIAIEGTVESNETIKRMTPDLHLRLPVAASVRTRIPQSDAASKRGGLRPQRPAPKEERIDVPPGFMREALLKGTSPVGTKPRRSQ